MGRKRTRDKHLPLRMYFTHGAYYFVPVKGSWVNLGKKYPAALRAYADLLKSDAPVNTMDLLIANYEAKELYTKAAKTQVGRKQEFKPIRTAFGHMNPESIEPHHAWTLFKALGQTEQARHVVRCLSMLMTYARRVGARKGQNPCFKLQLPGSGPRERYVTDEEFSFVRARAQPMVRHAMDLALVAGLDEGTIRKLERKNITDQGIQFERPKTLHQKRQIQIIEWNDDLREIIRAILRERPQIRRVLICNRKGQGYSLNGFQSQWQRTMRRAVKDGLAERFHFHDIRAKSASDAESDQEATDRLGHSNPETTRKIYRRKPRRAKALKNIRQKAGVLDT